MSVKLLVFDSHPVQYRVPIWQAISQLRPGTIHVVYATDCSVRGYLDEGFGQSVAWDEPMLEGYEHTILNCEKGTPLSGWASLTGKGVSKLIDELKPEAILLTGLNYRYDLMAYLEANRRGIPLWLRCETQDEAVTRSKSKSTLRTLMYRVTYKKFDRIYYIGELNRRHYLNHGVPPEKLYPAFYGTVDRFESMSSEEKESVRILSRANAGISDTDFVIGFSGKLIQKKNPGILYKMLKSLPEELRSRTWIYFLGSGELEPELQLEAQKALEQFNVRTCFAGFANQSKLAAHYLAMDILVLPSRRMGETWGLVANEAMQAGCGVVVSDAVGCHVDFKSLERFSVFKEGDSEDLAESIKTLSTFPRSFSWPRKHLENYSIMSTATALIEKFAAA
jgi:glycosyltransferase involved in cell wall biosynthesis